MTVQVPKRSGRGASRFRAGLPAVLTYPPARCCEAADLSKSGALLTGALPTPPRGRMDLTLTSAAGDLSLAVAVRIARVEPGDIGVEFPALSESQRQCLGSMLARVVEGVAPAPLAAIGTNARPEAIREALSKIPLAQRIALATRAGMAERRQLRWDSHPRVLEALTRNPQTIHDEALALARLVPLLPTTLELLARDPRWRSSEELRILVASHPRVSLQVAEHAAKGLGNGAQERLLRRPSIHPALRQKLVRLRGSRR